MVDAQIWLESQEKYDTKEKRAGLTTLNISKKDLEGSLNLNDFVNLEKLNCSYNQIVNLNLNNCQKLKVLDCGFNKLTSLNLNNLTQLGRVWFNDNYLSSFDYSSLNPEKLTSFNMSDNNLPEENLFVLSKFTKLEELWIGGDNKSHFSRNIYNRFFGSLEPLKNLTQLQSLYIDNTDINEGIEYLPESLRDISYSTERRPKGKVKEIAEQLGWIGKCFSGKQLKEWIKNGFQAKDYEFAFYLKKNGYHPRSILNYEKLREKYNKSQGWINKNYSREKRWEISEIYLSETDLEGEIDLEDFRWLRTLYISYYLDETKLEIKNKRENVKVIKLVNAQKWLDDNYPQNGVCIKDDSFLWNNKGKTRPEITLLNISRENLEGELDLNDFVSLISLRCCYNKLTSLDISSSQKLAQLKCWSNQLKELNINSDEITDLVCYDNKLTELKCTSYRKLKILDCHNNYLTNLDYSSLPTNRLTNLDVRNNNLLKQDCSVFERLVNLEELCIGNDSKSRIRQNIYNRFYGSLESLVKLTKIERLDISNTDINGGLEYLTDTVRELRCSTKERPESKVKKIEEQLNSHSGHFQTWKLWVQNQKFKKQWFIFTEQAKNIGYLEKRIHNLTNSIQEQREKIINAFLRLFPERDLLQELIKTYLEFIKFKKCKLDSYGYDEKCEKYEDKCQDIKKKLRIKLTKEEMDKVRSILTNCEELIGWELELEVRLSDNTFLIEKHRQNLVLQVDKQQTEERKIVEKEEAVNQDQLWQLWEQQQNPLMVQLQEKLTCAESKLKIKEEENRYLRGKRSVLALIPSTSQLNENLIGQLIKKLEESPVLTQKNIDKIKELFRAKRVLLDIRRETIEELKKCFNELESFVNEKRTSIKMAKSAVNSVEGIPVLSVFFKFLGGTVKMKNNYSKVRFFKKSSEEFQIFLASDENELVRVSNAHSFLISSLGLKNEKTKLFCAKYKVADVLINDGIWEGRSLSLDKMEKAIVSLSINLSELEEEVEREEEKFEEFERKISR